MTEEGNNNNNATNEHNIKENVVVLYFIMCIVASIIARELNRRFPVLPYTPLLILLGLLLGAVQVWGQISDGVEQVVGINPHGILTILLPILIFESSYNARLSILKANLFQILLLAIPGVIVTALMLTFCLKFIIGYDDDSLNIYEALVLGCVLGTTDPVAVVALLKELGAPLRTNMLIEMESLLNDGVAMVFFSIFLNIAKGGASSAGDGIVSFLRLAIGGPALGLAWGIGALIITIFMTKGKTYFMTIILLSSFSVFYTAEKLDAGVSGLLALVALGFFFSVFLKNQMTQGQEHAVHTILGYIQHLDESFLFFLTGTITGNKLVNEFSSQLEADDVWKMFILYLLLIVVRAIMVLFFAGCVRLAGQPVYFKEIALQIWGGLRGGLSLALALVVFQDEQLERERAKVLILFNTASLATLTLVLNGSTASFIVKWVGLISNRFEREKYKEIFEQKVKEIGLQAIDEQKQNETMSLTFWDGVLNLLKFKKEIPIKIDPTLPLQRYKVLRVFIEILQTHQGEQYLSKSIYNSLVEASEVACEQCANEIDIFTHAYNSLTSIKFIEYCRSQTYLEFLGKAFQFLTLFTLEENFSVIQLMILVLSQTIQQIQERTDEQDTLQIVAGELQNNLKKSTDLMFIYKSKFPGEIQKISQRQAAIKILVTQTQYIDSYMGSFITQKEGNEIKSFFFKRLEQTMSFKMLFELDSGPEYILESSFRGLLSDKELIKICQEYELKQASQGDLLIELQQPIDYCFLILEGIVEEEIQAQGVQHLQQIQYSTGNLVGVPNVVDKKVESVLQLVAKTDCQYLQIPISLIRSIFNQNTKFEQLCYKESLATFLVLYHSEKHNFNKFVHLQLYNWAMKAKLVKVDGTSDKMFEELILPINGAFVFEGEWLSLDGKHKYGQWAYIEPMKMQLKPTKQGIVLVFTNKLHLENKEGVGHRHSERSLSISREESMLLEHPGGGGFH